MPHHSQSTDKQNSDEQKKKKKMNTEALMTIYPTLLDNKQLDSGNASSSPNANALQDGIRCWCEVFTFFKSWSIFIDFLLLIRVNALHPICYIS